MTYPSSSHNMEKGVFSENSGNQTFPVFILSLKVRSSDPEAPIGRIKPVLFVQTASDGSESGYIHYLSRDYVSHNGAKYHIERFDLLQNHPDYLTREQIGITPASTYSTAWNELLESRLASLTYVKSNQDLLHPGSVAGLQSVLLHEEEELDLAREWTLNEAVPLLKEAGLIR